MIVRVQVVSLKQRRQQLAIGRAGKVECDCVTHRVKELTATACRPSSRYRQAI
jgi:hypothetical protein